MSVPLLAALAAPFVYAQGFDAQRYLPPVGSAGGLLIERPTVLGTGGGRWGVVFSSAKNPVVLRDHHSGLVLSRPVQSLTVMDVIGTLSVADLLEVGVDLPLFLAVQGDPMGSVHGSEGIGDVRIVPKVGLPDDEEGVRLGFALPIRLPTGSPWAFRGSGALTFEPQFLFGVRRDAVRLNGMVGYRSRPGLNESAPIGDELTFGAGLATRAIRDDVRVDFLLEWLGAVDLTRPANDASDVPVELLAGFEWRSRNTSFTAAAGPGLSRGLGTPSYRIVLGFNILSETTSRKYLRRPSSDHPHRPSPPEHVVAAKIRVTARQIDIDGEILFAAGSARIDSRSNALLDELAKALADRPDLGKIFVVGHTDSTGSTEFNEALSVRRAESVCAALVRRGVPSDRLAARGYGERRPIASNDTPEGRAANRRIDFLIREF